MVHHAEASRLNIERMKQIYQQLSCYRGLGKITMSYNVAFSITQIVKCFVYFIIKIQCRYIYIY